MLMTEEEIGPGWLEDIYREHARDVMQTAYRVTGNAEDAEDVLQTVFTRLAGRKGKPDFSRGAGAYLRRAAINAGLDVVRAKNASNCRLIGEIRAGGAGSTPERRLFGREIRMLLRAILSDIKSSHAEMFIMRYFEDHRLKDIAEVFGTTEGTVAVTLHRVRSRIRKELESIVGGIQ